MPRSAAANRRRRRLGFRLAGLQNNEDPNELTPRQREAVEFWREDPCNFLFATDPDSGAPLWLTKDERDSKAPVKPFPDLQYLREYITDIHTGRCFPKQRFSLHEAEIYAVEKSRQMIISTGTLAYISWECIFRDARQWIVSKITKDESEVLVRDKVRFPLSKMPPWLQRFAQASPRPAHEVRFGNSGSIIRCASMNMATRQGRGATATGVFVDEAPTQDVLGEILGATTPMATKIIMVGTPTLGGPGSGVAVFYPYIQFADDKLGLGRLREL